ncbi:hypothetical protein FSP39_008706, partial [Pinctada imbricata]
FSYIPMVESIKQFLDNDHIARMVFQTPKYSTVDGFLLDIIDGSVFKDHEIFCAFETSLQLLLYYDDVEICNPLGKKAGTHKIGVFYYSIANMPKVYRSRLPCIRLLSIVKRKVMNEYGIKHVLERINTDLIELSQGINIMINGEEKLVKGAVIAFIWGHSCNS